ncbi:MAG: hypothetical protein LGB07_00460 [Sulfurovum sp.]|nr:hypothetical protein [Sulfurovum sp.]MCB4744119.1 hypothetical protein [Sulfurovum sp.]MCB4746916.1 hypothetical protein [Sulfurovum sp.]MCB4747256.1 hypothetical protein [Sulfurovum sp.]MCB4749404.1 hypothetical protein [Sulfurovum sp.]
MIKVKAGLALLTLLLPLLLNATTLLKNDILNDTAAKYIEQMGKELVEKTGIHGYVIATNEHFPERFNLVAYSKRYEEKVSKPYVIFIFAPFALITKQSQQRGRVAVISSSTAIASMYDKGEIMDATIDIVASIDKNKIEDKYAIGVVQGFSELADEIAHTKGIELKNTIKETRQGIWVIQAIVFFGASIIFWLFIFRPLYRRIKYGKEN